MAKNNRYFLLGVFIAAFFLTVIAGNRFFQAVFAGSGMGSLPRELRLGVELGIIGQNKCTTANLKRTILRREFAEKLSTVLDLLGFSNNDLKQLAAAGIISNAGLQAQMTRKDAVEIMARTAMALKDASMISFPENECQNFKDYRVPEKYRAAVSYLQRKYVVRGLPDGSLGGSRRLSQRDAVFFTYRFYEAVAADLMGSRESQGISFVDIPLSHPIMKSVKNLTAAGAFDKIILRPSFDGDSFISITDMNEILGGIFARSGKEIDLTRMKAIFAQQGASSYATRRQLALLLEYVLDSFAKDRLNAAKITYVDISIEKPEFESLVKLAGCGLTMGYGDGRFAGDEAITWFETVSLLNEVIKYASLVEQPATVKTRLAVKSDIEDLKTLLRAKREKIRKILKVSAATGS
ncbi:MAG: hypothetical protein PHD82_07820 [Candidatus Riflebacteria bacterium]|nr:hypothetical protein [Candidatus Riflebacteria bacterium]